MTNWNDLEVKGGLNSWGLKFEYYYVLYSIGLDKYSASEGEYEVSHMKTISVNCY